MKFLVTTTAIHKVGQHILENDGSLVRCSRCGMYGMGPEIAFLGTCRYFEHIQIIEEKYEGAS